MSSDLSTAFRKEAEGRSADLIPKLKGYKRALCDLDGQAHADVQDAINDAERRLRAIDAALLAVMALDNDGYPEWNDRIVDATVLKVLREHNSTINAAFRTFHSIEVKATVGKQRETPEA